MQNEIRITDMTLDQYRKFKGIKVIPDVQKVLHIPTYYRIKDWKNKNSSQTRTLDKLKELLWVDDKTLGILIENQLKQK